MDEARRARHPTPPPTLVVKPQRRARAPGASDGTEIPEPVRRARITSTDAHVTQHTAARSERARDASRAASRESPSPQYTRTLRVSVAPNGR